MITPREILKDPSLRQADEFKYWGHTTSLEAMLGTLEKLEGYSSLLDLDPGDDSDISYHAAYLLGQLPPKVVFEHYGEEGLLHVACNALGKDIVERFQEALRDTAGYNTSLLDKAMLWAYQKRHTSQCREVLSQYAVMETVTGGWLDGVDLGSILLENLKPGVEVGERRLADYSLLPLCSSDSRYEPAGWERTWTRDIAPPKGSNEPIVRYGIWLDAPTGYALAYKGRPQALVALECVGRRELMISQLQGVRAKRVNPAKKYSEDGVIGSIASRGLAPFDWQRVMVTVAERLAAELGLDSLAIQGGENNVWRHKRLRGETAPHITAETAARAYDEPAERLGFTRLNDGNWHRKVA